MTDQSLDTGRLIPILEVGGTHVTAAVIATTGWQVLRSARRELDGHAGTTALLDEFAAAAAALGRLEPGQTWGVAVPGPFDYARGIARFEGVGKFDSLRGVDLAEALAGRLATGRDQVTFINDASAFLVGEWLVGAARGCDRAVALTLGTGVGSAFLRDGQVIDSGPDVPPEAEVHLLSYQGRPLEDTVSRRALREQYGQAARLRPDETPDVRELADAARSGDAAAAAVFTHAYQALGEVVAPWLRRFHAQRLVIGGSISGAWDLIAEPLVTGLGDSIEAAEVVLAGDPDRAALVGAAYPAYLLS